MRFIGIILALGAVGWVLYQASSGEEGAVPDSYQQSIKKAESVEQTVQDAAKKRLLGANQHDQ